MSKAFTTCAKCGMPIPNEALVCACGRRQAFPAPTMSSDPPLEVLQRRLEQLQAGIGWWQSADGTVANARAAFLELDVVLHNSERCVLVIDHVRGQLVSEQRALMTLEGAQAMAVQTAMNYAGDQHRVAFAPVPKYVDAVVRETVYEWDAILNGRPMMISPRAGETLGQLQQRVSGRASTWSRMKGLVAPFRTRIDRSAACVWLEKRTA